MIPVTLGYRIPGLGTDARLVLFGAFAVAGISLQILAPGVFMVGTLLLALPLVLLRVKPWTNKPRDLGEEDWQPTGAAELDRIADAFRNAKKLKIPFWYKSGSGIVFTVLILFMYAFSAVALPRVELVFLDALILFWPALHFIRVKIWVPRDFEMVMGALQAARSVPPPEDVILTPYLRLDRDDAGLRIPEDARLMVEPRRKPEDLVGIQVQAAINSGANGRVPYLYAVVLTRGQGPSWKKAAALRARGFEVEAGGDDAYGTVVIRQDTGNGGYHTAPDDCRALMTLVYGVLQQLR